MCIPGHINQTVPICFINTIDNAAILMVHRNATTTGDKTDHWIWWYWLTTTSYMSQEIIHTTNNDRARATVRLSRLLGALADLFIHLFVSLMRFGLQGVCDLYCRDITATD